MLIKKEIDPVALEVFKKHVEPILPELSKEERNLAYGFLIDPAGDFKEILRYYGVRTFDDLLEEGEKPLFLRMAKEYAEKKGWVKEEQEGEKHFIWERNIKVDFEEDKNGEFLPRHYWDPPLLKKVKEALEEIKEKGAEEFLEIETKIGFDVYWSKNELYISPFLASKALGRKVKNEEKLSFEETEKIVDYLYEQWKKLKKL